MTQTEIANLIEQAYLEGWKNSRENSGGHFSDADERKDMVEEFTASDSFDNILTKVFEQGKLGLINLNDIEWAKQFIPYNNK